jgi:hypothetical protein
MHTTPPPLRTGARPRSAFRGYRLESGIDSVFVRTGVPQRRDSREQLRPRAHGSYPGPDLCRMYGQDHERRKRTDKHSA